MRRTLIIIAIALLVGAGIIGIGIISVLASVPPPDIIENRRIPETTKVFDRTGEILLYELYGDEKRTVVPISAVPEIVKQATIAIEDENFYTHHGIDIPSILRAILANISQGGIVQGGSTITQQLAKKAFLSDERTLTRKLRELVLARRLEERYSKDEILEYYLNQIPYDARAYGIEAASEVVFEKHVGELTLAEAALLASLPQAPSYYSPWGQHVEELLRRKNLVLNRMHELGFISADELETARNETLTFTKPFTGIKAPHFVTTVIEQLNNQFGEEFVRTKGLTVITTLDADLQEIAERVVTDGVARNTELYQGTNGALVAQDPITGEVLALVGSRDYFDIDGEGNFNVATQGLRQPGSAIKPFVYAAAFEKGFTPDTVLFDLETEFDTTGIEERSYVPQNFDEVFRGPVTLRTALAQSINIPSVKTLYLVGLRRAIETAQRFGLTTLTEVNRYGLSLVLGGGEVHLIDLVGAYATFANDGVRNPQRFIREIQTGNRTLEQEVAKPTRVINSQIARLINDILSDQSARRPLFQSSFNLTTFRDYDIALKTGTTNDYRDAWTVGYTPRLVVGVWAGNNDNTPMQRQGGSILAAIPMWHDFIDEALPNVPPDAFLKPAPIVAEKPMLRGKHIVTYDVGATTSPQIHSILFYVDSEDPQGPEPINPESDPQFHNWETPVLAWARTSIPNFEASYNAPLPPIRTLADNISTETSSLSITINEPLNGSFTTGAVTVSASIQAPETIVSIQLLVNETVIDTVTGSFGNSYQYTHQITPGSISFNLQNNITVSASTLTGTSNKKSVIVFTSP